MRLQHKFILITIDYFLANELMIVWFTFNSSYPCVWKFACTRIERRFISAFSFRPVEIFRYLWHMAYSNPYKWFFPSVSYWLLALYLVCLALYFKKLFFKNETFLQKSWLKVIAFVRVRVGQRLIHCVVSTAGRIPCFPNIAGSADVDSNLFCSYKIILNFQLKFFNRKFYEKFTYLQARAEINLWEYL